MEYVYLAGVGLNLFGYIQLTKMLGRFDNTSVFSVIKNASAIGGLIAFVFGFVVFQWWVPITGLVFSPLIIGLLISFTPLALLPQIAIGIGLLLSVVGLVAA